MFNFKYFFVQLLFVCVVGIKCDLEHNIGLLPTDCGLSNEDYILTSAPLLDEFPWMAIIANTGNSTKYICTGTIINAEYILTSAQCVQNVYVRIGEYNLSTELDCIGDETVGIDCLNNTQDFEVEEKKVHENFTTSADSTVNDIALLRLKKKIDFSFDNIRPICLPIQEQDITKNRGKIVVWGLNKSKYTTVMRKYDVWLTPIEECYKKCNSTPSSKDEFVSEYCVRKEDVYNADIGGPLMFRTFRNNRLAQHGVASRETAECVFYTNVANYINWVLENIRE